MTPLEARFVSFDGTERCTGPLLQPDRYEVLSAALREPGAHAIRGGGLSYCLASAGERVKTISTRSFDRVLHFDRERRRLRVEPGLTVGTLLRFAVAHDSFFPVLPGHPSITVGGCTGFNVHGKTQHNVGHFSDHVESITLHHPDHGELACSPQKNKELFDLTIGGMGLTGYIADVTLRLAPLPGRSVRRVVHPVASVIEAVDVMNALRERSDALYAWNDLNQRGKAFGRGFVYDERFEPAAPPDRVRYRTLTAESRGRLPLNVSTHVTTRLTNIAYRAKERFRSDTLRSVADAAFPINGNEAYFKLFGRRGFREYQILFPSSVWPDVVPDFERVVAASDVAVTLGSLKLFAGTPSLLSFRRDGICVTIDAAAGDATLDLFAELDRLAIASGALVNFSKDSRLTGDTVEALFPDYAGVSRPPRAVRSQAAFRLRVATAPRCLTWSWGVGAARSHKTLASMDLCLRVLYPRRPSCDTSDRAQPRGG